MIFLFILILLALTVNSLSDSEQWQNFKAKYGKYYKNQNEENTRFKIFQNNLRKIEEHNKNYELGKFTYNMGINQFADITQQEYSQKLKRQTEFVPKVDAVFESKLDDVPDAIDWREHNAVLEVRDQRYCQASWAFSAVGALEAQNAILFNKQIALSPQQIVDCSGSYGNDGCSRNGSPEYSFLYVENHGIQSEESYPYTEKQGTCEASGSSEINVSGYRTVRAREQELKVAVAQIGPISAKIFSGVILSYVSGVFLDDVCYVDDYVDLDLSVLIVGYGNDTSLGLDFWILKFPWGDTFGENGYVRLARGYGQCGIAMETSYPFINVTTTV